MAIRRAEESEPRSPVALAKGGPTVLRILLGSQLRRLRQERGISREEAGYAIRASHAKISRIELGKVGFKERDVADLLTLYGVTDPADRALLLDLVEQANAPGWWREYADLVPPWMERFLGLEQSASVIRTWEVQFVPGLLQTPDYARAVITNGNESMGAEEVERWVALRMRRQRILFPPAEVRLWAIIDEGALLRRIGGPGVMRAQLIHLLHMIELPNVTVQVLRLDGPQNPRALRPVTLLRAAADILPDVAYCENLCGGRFFDRPADTVRFLDLLNWLSVHAASPRETPGILRGIIARIDAEEPAAAHRR